MPFIIGTDEAGYGPNLGPLVVGATLWEVPDDVGCLYDALKNVVCKVGHHSSATASDKIPIGDSKALYQSHGSLAKLERSVLTMLGVTDAGVPENLPELFQMVAEPAGLRLADETTYHWHDVNFPAACDRDIVDSLAMRMREEMANCDIRCHKLVATIVFPEEFNQGLNHCGNKASLLSAVTCRLARKLVDSLVPEDQDVTVLCDKHGGRSRYAGLLQQEMTDSFVRVLHEERESSCYQWQESRRQMQATFLAKGERYLPVGLASMLAKYLRELSMEAWNLFWCQRLPTLRPTAGYPGDAKRFKKEIAPLQTKLNVDDRLIWRQK